MKRTSLSLLAAAVLGAAALAGPALPRAEAAGPSRWRLEFTPGAMDVAVVGAGRATANWHLAYTLRNPTDASRRPRVRLELRTDTGQTYGDHFDPLVTKAAEKATGKRGLRSTASLRAEDLEAGASTDALANFGSIDPNADVLSVRVYGLWDPVYRTAKGKVLRENRVLVLTYDRPGDEYDRQLDRATLRSTSQEIEGEVVELYQAGVVEK